MDEMAVMERFAFYRGLNEEEAQPYFTLVRDAIAQIEEARRKDIPGGETLLCAAAAALANWQASLLNGGGSFSAGEVRMQSGCGATEKALWEQAKRAASPFLQDHFYFGRVL